MNNNHEDDYDDDMVERIVKAFEECQKSPALTAEELIAELDLKE